MRRAHSSGTRATAKGWRGEGGVERERDGGDGPGGCRGERQSVSEVNFRLLGPATTSSPSAPHSQSRNGRSASIFQHQRFDWRAQGVSSSFPCFHEQLARHAPSEERHRAERAVAKLAKSKSELSETPGTQCAWALLSLAVLGLLGASWTACEILCMEIIIGSWFRFARAGARLDFLDFDFSVLVPSRTLHAPHAAAH